MPTDVVEIKKKIHIPARIRGPTKKSPEARIRGGMKEKSKI